MQHAAEAADEELAAQEQHMEELQMHEDSGGAGLAGRAADPGANKNDINYTADVM